MSDEKRMTRREALKKMGAVADGIGLGIGGVYAIDALELSEKEEMTEADALILGSSTYSAEVNLIYNDG